MLNKSEIQKIKTVSYYTAKEIIKSKILLNTLIIGVGLFIATYVAYNFTYGAPDRVALDFGLGTLSLSTVGIALFIGAGIISNEIDSRTVYLVISRPVSRSSFLLGKLIGLFIVLALNVLILSTITLSLYFFIGGEYSSLISWAILFIGIEATLMLAVVAFFSLITSKVMAVIYSIVLYIVGHSIDGAKLVTFVQKRPAVEFVLDFYHFLLPGFYKLNLKDYILYEQKISSSYLFGSSIYGVIYGLAVVLLSIFIFKKKNLD